MLANPRGRRKRIFQILQQRGDAGADRLTTRRVCLSVGSRAALLLEREEAIVVLQEGNVIQYDTPDGIYNRPAAKFVAGFTGSPP